jgi:molybdopterin synthase catalytic subunit
MNKVQVFFFATLRDKVGTKEAQFEIPIDSTISEFKQFLIEKYPRLAESMDSTLVAINKEYAFDHEKIPERAELALFPPVSGGGGFPTIFEITENELDLNLVLKEITLPSTGASCFFSGMVRGVTKREDPHETEYLEYEAYTDMAKSKMKQISDEIRQKWPSVEGIAIIQRIGRLLPGTPTVVIACTAGHRDTGVFEAARYGIDRVKEIVPIWKKEIGPRGEIWIEGEYIPKPGE